MAVHTATRAVLANTQLPSLPKHTHTHTHTHTHVHMHAHTHALFNCAAFSVVCFYLELLKQSNSWYVWLIADFVFSIICWSYLVKYQKLLVNTNPEWALLPGHRVSSVAGTPESAMLPGHPESALLLGHPQTAQLPGHPSHLCCQDIPS